MTEETVRATYREVATERTPEQLDKAVLTEAGRAARPRYSRLVTWTRPAAWAVTVMLSVALVLQLTDTPEMQPATDVAPASAEDDPAEDAAAGASFEPEAFEMQDSDMLQRAEEMARTREGTAADNAFAASGAVGLRAVAAPTCDDAVSGDPETWLDCIEGLEEAGFDDEAARQRELLTAAFPDFEPD